MDDQQLALWHDRADVDLAVDAYPDEPDWDLIAQLQEEARRRDATASEILEAWRKIRNAGRVTCRRSRSTG